MSPRPPSAARAATRRTAGPPAPAEAPTPTAYGQSDIGGYVNVTASQTGGSGGSGYNGAAGGAAASSIMQNQVSGYTAGGELDLYQVATGGDGGSSYGGGVAANGGYAESDLGSSSSHYIDSAAGVVNGNAIAFGGNGGSTDTGTVGVGGNANASIYVETSAAT